MNEDLLPIENFHGIFGRLTLARLNTMAEAVYRYVQMEPAIIDRLVFDDDEPSSQGGATLVYPAKITAVQGAGIAATYNAVALDDATIVLANQTPVNRPFGTADIIEAVVDDKCLICLLPANPGDTSTVGFLVQLTEKAKFTNCQQQQPPPGANAPVTPANIGAPPKLSVSAMQAAGYSLNEQLDYLLSFANGIYHTVGTAINYTVTDVDYYIGVTDTSAARTITIPSASGFPGKVFIIKDESAAAGTNNITVQASSGNIDGVGTYVISTNSGAVTLMRRNGGYFVT